MSDGNGSGAGAAWVARNLVSIIIVVTAIAGVGGNWYVTGDRIESLRADHHTLRGDLSALSGRMYGAESKIQLLEQRVQWLERQLTTRSSLEPRPQP